MVFANLNSREKDAFFSLLDEYFSSRPELLNRPGQATPDEVKTHAAAAIHNAFSKTTPQEAASVVSGFRRVMPPPPARPDASASAASEPEVQPVAGRVAAAAAAFGASGPPLPRPPPRRAPSSEEQESSVNKLTTQKRFGDVDVSSGKAMFSSLRNSTANKSATPPQVAPPTPSAFPRRTSNYPPPPNRTSSIVSHAPSTPSPPPPPPRPRVPEPEPEGEWAEALYEYTSDDPGDLTLEEGVRVLIVEKTSDDWWTGEIDGRRGLVPAAYVKML